MKNFDVEVRITRKEEAAAFPAEEQMLVGWEEIAAFLGLNRWLCCEYFNRELSEAGVTFKKKVTTPRSGNQPRKYVCTYPSLLLAWVVRKTLLKRAGRRERAMRALGECIAGHHSSLPGNGGRRGAVVKTGLDGMAG